MSSSGIILGLERITSLLEALGNPHKSYPCIHVAGTNGKGSVTHYISSVLSGALYKVGTYNSPYLIEPRDAIRLNQEPVSSDLYDQAKLKLQQLNESRKFQATNFELETALAFYIFAEQKVDIAVVEVGMGGLLDATNVIPPPIVCIITKIGMDHMEFLGRTVEEIATQKAGIIKMGADGVVIGAQSFLGATAVVYAKAQEQGVHTVEPTTVTFDNTQKTIEFSFLGEKISSQCPDTFFQGYQLENLGTALAALEIIHSRLHFSTDKLISSLFSSRSQWKGRLSWINIPALSTRRCLIDGAHNEQGIQALSSYVNSLRVSDDLKTVIWVTGFKKGKDIKSLLKKLVHLADTLIAMPFSTPSNMPWASCTRVEEIVRIGKELGVSKVLEGTSLSDLKTLFSKEADEHTLVVFCGSLYFIADVYRRFEESL